MSWPRRVFVSLLLALASAAVVAYVIGVRYPPLQFVMDDLPTRALEKGIQVESEGAIFQSLTDDGALMFRAFVPEPRLTLRTQSAQEWRLIVNNVHRDASLSSTTPDDSWREDRVNLTRTITGRSQTGGTIRFAWRFPTPDRFRFAAIGDTGGNTELLWVLRRAADLEADFILHLGDFVYERGDFERARKAFDAALIPSFVAIGNHEFHSGWRSTHQKFTQHIGPLNSTFTLGGVQFVNLDTAADHWPPYRGARARLLQQLPVVADGGPINEYVVYTHRPLADPDPVRDHDINGLGEADWLRERLLGLGVQKLLVGHIHIKEEYDDGGLHTYITGQGLAHADLIVGEPLAEILIGDVENGRPVQYRWEPLNMPVDAHCSARNLGVLETIKRLELLDRLRSVCARGD